MYRRLPQVQNAPKGALKFTCKGADAVAYVWNETGRDGKTRYLAKVYFGKAGKPRVYAWYRTAEAREHAVSLAFKGAIVGAEYKAKLAAERKAFVNPFKVGDVFRCSWGYDQTNVDYYQCVGVAGSMLDVREISAESEETGDMTGRCVPTPDAFVGNVKRYKAQLDGFKVESFAFARFVEPQLVAGCKVYPSSRWSSYA